MPENQAFTLVGIYHHKREWVGRWTIHHTATAIIENYAPEHMESVASKVSIEAGYHPAGYGIYHQYTKIEPTGIENEYRVTWQTSSSCD